MGYVWVERIQKHKPAPLESAPTNNADELVVLAESKPANKLHIPGSFSVSKESALEISCRTVNIKVAECVKCGGSEQAEEDFVMFHCGKLRYIRHLFNRC